VHLPKQMSPDQGYMCLNCRKNKNNNTSMSHCTLSFINNKYIYSLSVVALFQKPNNINNVCQAPESSFCHCHSKTQRILLSQIIGNTVLSQKITFLHEQFLKPLYFLRPKKQNIKYSNWFCKESKKQPYH
jgi:hypothetical protein